MGLSSEEKARIQALLLEAIVVKCNHGFAYNQLTVEGLIGVTINNQDVFLININEKFMSSEVSAARKKENHTNANETKLTNSPRSPKHKPRARKRKLSQALDGQDQDEQSREINSNLPVTSQGNERAASSPSDDCDTTGVLDCSLVTVKDEQSQEIESLASDCDTIASGILDCILTKFKDEPKDTDDDEADVMMVLGSVEPIDNFQSVIKLPEANSTSTPKSRDRSHCKRSSLVTRDAGGDASSVNVTPRKHTRRSSLEEESPTQFSTRKHLIRNSVKNISPTKFLPICIWCGYIPKSIKNLWQHEETHLTKYHECRMCEYRSHRKSDLKRHMRTVHDEACYGSHWSSGASVMMQTD